MDSYQAIYDAAVRSRIYNVDIGRIVEDALRQADLSHHVSMAARAWADAASEQLRPSVVFRPTLSRDGNAWCALFGANLHEGVAGFGASPAEAMYDFDNAWHKKVQP